MRGFATILAFGLMLFVDGCGGSQTSKPPLRAAPTEAELAAGKSLVEASNELGWKALAKLCKQDSRPNRLISPASLGLCMAMVAVSSEGPAHDEIMKALGQTGVKPEQLSKNAKALTDALLSDPERPLSVANAIWSLHPIRASDAFKEELRKSFDATIRVSPDPAKALQEINGWVKESTHGMIPKLMDQIEGAEFLFFLDALAFEARWATEFDPAHTKPGPFRTALGQEVEVPLMNGSRGIKSYASGEIGAIQMDYLGGRFSMIAVLPEEGEPAESLLSTLGSAGLEDLIKKMGHEGYVRFPKFTFHDGYKLNDALKSLGIQDAFTSLDLTRMDSSLSGVFINRVLQKCFIQVDEKGTKAAAVTGAAVASTGPMPLVFTRPFLFAIRHNATGALLFLGILGDPSKTE